MLKSQFTVNPKSSKEKEGWRKKSESGDYFIGILGNFTLGGLELDAPGVWIGKSKKSSSWENKEV